MIPSLVFRNPPVVSPAALINISLLFNKSPFISSRIRVGFCWTSISVTEFEFTFLEPLTRERGFWVGETGTC